MLFLPLLSFCANESVKLKKIVEDNCHQSISSMFAYESNITNICNFNYINQFPKKAQMELSSIENKITILEKSKIKQKDNSEKIIKLDTKIKDLRNSISEINTKNTVYIKTIEKSLENQDIKTSKNLKSMKNEFLNLDSNLKGVNSKLNNYISKTDKSIQDIVKINKEQDNKLEKLSQYIRDFNNINLGVDFLYYKTINIGLNIEIENFDKKENSSNFIKLSYVKLTETNIYTTLGLEKEKLNNDRNLYSLDMGYQKFFNTHALINKSKMYLGASLGGVYIHDDNKYSVLSGSLLCGIEYNDMFLAELGYKYISDVSSKHIDFDGLGRSNVYYKEEDKWIPFISVKYLWR